MDLVGYDRAASTRSRRFRDFAASVGSSDVTAIPVSALAGDNVTRRSERMPWYDGPTLLELLETAEPDEDAEPARRSACRSSASTGPTRISAALPARRGRRGPPRRRGAGHAGRARRAGRADRRRFDGDLDAADGRPVGHPDLRPRGRLLARRRLAAPSRRREVADQFEATLVWMAEEALLPGRQYALKLGTQHALATIQPPKYEIDVNRCEHARGADAGAERDRRRRSLRPTAPLAFAPYAESRELGGFILIDRVTQRHGRRRADPLRAAPLAECPRAGARR